ncbi:acyl-CoA thioesterase domain-containing protein [Nonomuraea harbinensis]|uniref:Acyl-CoA thioesterase domain-containing protein n=1 Tax=Nonomuraea harbinensis TaxID=1286938 RepID=A0ABW1BY72_9ACTN|nr:acyl-CoA thioesterase domain-containing protein [Nonomuraea harbinensis]
MTAPSLSAFDVDSRTEIIRTGRRAATGQVVLSQEGKERLRATATFGTLDQADGRTLVTGEPPVLPDPDDCVDPLGGKSLDGVSNTERVEFRFAEVPDWWRGSPPSMPE